jgi:hypothetical protein
MIMLAVAKEHPEGLPVGDVWEPTAGTDEIRFPFDSSLAACAPIGSNDMARRAVDAALAIRAEVGRLPSHVRRTALLATHEALTSRRTAGNQAGGCLAPGEDDHPHGDADHGGPDLLALPHRMEIRE